MSALPDTFFHVREKLAAIMTTLTIPELLERIEYPECDGLPMSDNTEQWDWMVLIKEGLEALFVNEPNVFVAGNLLWYPVEGDNRLRVAPDAMVAFGRPKGPRGSYKQWCEGGVAPQVVFEIVSPGNPHAEILEKIDFYEEYGVEEFYLYDPDRKTLHGFRRQGDEWLLIPNMMGWVSPRLNVEFDLEEGRLVLRDPDGQRFLSYVELVRLRDQSELLAKRELQRAEKEELRADQLSQLAEQEQQRVNRLAEKLRALGVDPDSV